MWNGLNVEKGAKLSNNEFKDVGKPAPSIKLFPNQYSRVSRGK